MKFAITAKLPKFVELRKTSIHYEFLDLHKEKENSMNSYEDNSKFIVFCRKCVEKSNKTQQKMNQLLRKIVLHILDVKKLCKSFKILIYP